MNVNPFFSLHLNKDESGEKTLHPSINLHITPSEQIFTKLIDKKYHIKKAIIHKKLNNISPGPLNPQLYSHPPIFHHVPEQLPYLSYGDYVPPYGRPGLINEQIPFPATGPIYYDHPSSGFNPLYDAPPSFSVSSHYRNANNYTDTAREGKAFKNKNIIFPNNRKKRTVNNIDNVDSHHILSRSRVSLILI